MDFRKVELSPSPSDVGQVIVKAPNPLGMHPTSMSYVYRVFFITLICHGWAYGCTLTLLGLCNRWAGVKENWGMAELE